MIKKILYYLLAFLAIGLAGNSILGNIILKPGSLTSPEFVISYSATIWNTIKIMLHACFASLAIVIGIPQLHSGFRIKFPKTNLVFRNIYFFSVLVASVSGFFLAFIAQGGINNTFGFATLAITWFIATSHAFYYSIKNDMPNFRVWMVRSYALTTTAINLRIYIGLWAVYAGPDKIPDVYQILGYFTWVPTMVITEYFILPRLNTKKIISKN